MREEDSLEDTRKIIEGINYTMNRAYFVFLLAVRTDAF